MFKASMIGVSNFSFSYFEAIKDIILSNTMTYTADDEVQFIDKKGNIYLPFSRDLHLHNNFPNFSPSKSGNTNMSDRVGFSVFQREKLDPSITTVKYNKTISMPTLLKQLAADPTVYGVVIQSGGRDGYAINPLHPMIAFMVAAGLHTLPEEGELHIYKWKDSYMSNINRSIRNNKEEIKKYHSDYKEFFALSPDIVKESIAVKQTASISDSAITSIIQEPFIENVQDIVVDVRRSEPGNRDISLIKTVVIPNQLVVGGSLSPYYGVTLLNNPTSGNIVGSPLSPGMSGNINVHHGNSRSYREIYSSGEDGNVCAGGANSAAPSGWFTLSRVNLGSMYFDEIIKEEDYIPFVSASKKIAEDTWSVVEANLNEELNTSLDVESSPEE